MRTEGKKRCLIILLVVCSAFCVFTFSMAFSGHDGHPDSGLQIAADSRELNSRLKSEIVAYDRTMSEMNRLTQKLKLHQQNFAGLRSAFGKNVSLTSSNRQELQRTFQSSLQYTQTLSQIQKQVYDDAMRILQNVKAQSSEPLHALASHQLDTELRPEPRTTSQNEYFQE